MSAARKPCWQSRSKRRLQLKTKKLAFRSALLLVLLALICFAVQAQEKQNLDLRSLKITKAYTAPSIENCEFGGTLSPWKGRKLVIVELSGVAPTKMDFGVINILFFAAVNKAKLQPNAVGKEVEGKVSWAPCGLNSKGSLEYLSIPAQTHFKILLAFPNIPQDVSKFDVLWDKVSLGTAILEPGP